VGQAARRSPTRTGRISNRGAVAEDLKEVAEKADALLDHVEAEAIGLGGTPPGLHTELNETFDALEEAEKVAARRGWEAVPWRELLDDLLAVSAG
jgi:hypothetical protein